MALDPIPPTDDSPSRLVDVDSILAPFADFEPLDQQVGQRQHQRLVAPPCRPVRIQLLQPDGAPRTDWLDADILDLSQGGVCLLIMDGHALNVSDRLMLDVQAPLGSALPLLPGLVRWFVRSCDVITLGVGFEQSLPDLPQLLPERRHRLRHPPATGTLQDGDYSKK